MRHSLSRTLFFIAVFAVLSGCMTAREAPRLGRHNEATCESPVVGTFLESERWALKAPALVLNGSHTRPLHGDSIRVQGDSVYFDPVRQSPFVDPEPRWYRESELVVAVDERGFAALGRVPPLYRDSWSARWYIRPEGAEDVTAYLDTNGDFQYCIDPGVYEVHRMSLMSQQGYIIETLPGPWLTFDVETNATNYLGAWTLDTAEPDDATSIAVLGQIVRRPGQGMMGQMFGLVGALVEFAILSGLEDGVRPVLNGKVETLPEPIWERPVRISEVVRTRESVEAAALNR